MTASRHVRRPWTMNEEQELVTLWREGRRGREIGELLGRSRSGVYCHVKKHHERLGILVRTQPPPWHRGELNLIERELELAITRIKAGLPHRQRPSITQRMNEFLFGDAKRLKKRERTAAIVRAAA